MPLSKLSDIPDDVKDEIADEIDVGIDTLDDDADFDQQQEVIAKIAHDYNISARNALRLYVERKL